MFMYLFLGRTRGKRVVAGINRFSAGKPIVRKLTSNVGARCTSGQFHRAWRRGRPTTTQSRLTRDARVEVLILTHRALFFPYRARVHRLFHAQEVLPQNRTVLGNAAMAQWENRAISKPREKKKIKKKRTDACICCVRIRSFARIYM